MNPRCLATKTRCLVLRVCLLDRQSVHAFQLQVLHLSPSFVVFELASLLLPAQMASTLVMRMLTAMVLLLALVLAFLSMASAMNASKQAPIHSMSHDSM